LRPVKRAALAIALSALTLAASAQSRLPPGVRGGTGAMATRSVSQYLDLERGLATALHEHRREAVLKMLAADFELRSAATLDALPAADWVAAQMASGAAEGRVRDLAVREIGAVAVVSFWLDSGVEGRRQSTVYVVDVWNQDAHSLAARYTAQPMRPLQAPTRPRGRE
ncbi:MAG: hypothetical protein M3Z16_11505, partial [Pseudomonadota bacterium]|nr:hypothetical protein [Pseudomonadota bacterium]